MVEVVTEAIQFHARRSSQHAVRMTARLRAREPPTQLTMKPPNKRNRKMIAAAISRNTRATILTRQPARGNPGRRGSRIAYGAPSTS